MVGWLKFQTRGESATCASIQFITDRPTLCSDEKHKYGGGRALSLIAVDRVVALGQTTARLRSSPDSGDFPLLFIRSRSDQDQIKSRNRMFPDPAYDPSVLGKR
jgi:hypothetical protein